MRYFPDKQEGIGGRFAGLMCALAKSEDPLLECAARLAADAVRQGHVCADLSMVHQFAPLTESDCPSPMPEASAWIETIGKTAVVGAPGEYRPLILDNTRLYLHAYWQYEQTLYRQLTDRTRRCFPPADPIRFASLLKRYFPDEDAGRTACCVAGLKNVLVVSGGPGTGKTTAVAKIAAFLLEYGAAGQGRIALTAPTGKAAARLMQSFRQVSSQPVMAQTIQNALPREASTIHRLLGALPDSTHYAYNAENLLPFDIVIIDEASMADLALLSKLLVAVPKEAKVIIVGDKDQLAAVDAGAVLGDICDSGDKHGVSPAFAGLVSSIAPDMALPSIAGQPPIADSIVELKKNYRFRENSGIGGAGNALKEGRAADAWNIVENGGYSDIIRRPLPPVASLYGECGRLVVGRFADYCKETDPAAALDIFNSFRVLCALNNGPYGVAGINATVERACADAGILRPFSRWYPGRPVMVIANDYRLGLFNGDCGITLVDPADCELKVFFPGGSTGEVRSFSPSRLPLHETVFAMTIHKAQGSEFDKVLIVLPPVFSPILSRELLYTALTRARSECAIWCSKEIFLKAAENRTVRMSGLRDKLWKKDEGASA